MKKISAFILSTVILCSFTITAFADAVAWDIDPADYTVYISAQGAGTDFRAGPGKEYKKLLDRPIPDSTELLLFATYEGWGYTQYNNINGWVNLSYTTMEKPQETTQAITSSATAEKTVNSQAVTQQTTFETSEASTAAALSETVSAVTQTQNIGAADRSSDTTVITVILFAAIIILVAASIILIILIARKRAEH